MLCLFDLGVSSPQLDRADRGFCYRYDGPLDMRMDRTRAVRGRTTSSTTYDEAELAAVLRRYGDERFAGRIARAIVAARPIDSTVELAEIVRHAIPAAARRTRRSSGQAHVPGDPHRGQPRARHPARRDRSGDRGHRAGGRVVVLSYHSGEDRIVKQRFRHAVTGGCTCPPRLPCQCGARPASSCVWRGGHTPTEAELARNARAQSARLPRRRTTCANGECIMTVTRRPTRPSPRPQPREVDPEFTELVEAWLTDNPEIEVDRDTDSDADEIAVEREIDVPSRVSIGLVGTLAFIFVFGALFGLAAFHSVLVQNQLRLDRLSRDVEREQARYQDLRIEYGQAAAPFRILAQAGAPRHVAVEIEGALASGPAGAGRSEGTECAALRQRVELRAARRERTAGGSDHDGGDHGADHCSPDHCSPDPGAAADCVGGREYGTDRSTAPTASTAPTPRPRRPRRRKQADDRRHVRQWPRPHDRSASSRGPDGASPAPCSCDVGCHDAHRHLPDGAIGDAASHPACPPHRVQRVPRASRIVDLVAPRGAIVDRYNRDLVLTTQAKTIAVDPTLLADIPAAAFQLAPIFSLGVTDLEQRLLKARDGKLHFAYIARQVTEAQAAEALGLGHRRSLHHRRAEADQTEWLRSSARRCSDRPTSTTSARAGWKSSSTRSCRARRASSSSKRAPRAARSRAGCRTGVSAVSGNTLVLSIDRPLQFEVDQLLQQAVDKYGAEYGVAIVSRVGTSEILANSVVHRVEGKPAEPTTENRAVTWGWEPGSIMKAITISALIDSGTVDIDTEFLVPAKLDVHDVTYTDDHLHPTEMMTAEKIIQDSSNVGTIMMTQELGEAKLHQYLTNFGLESYTGLGFPGESAGYVGNYGRWDGTTLSSYAIGQSIIVTPMQMLMALNTLRTTALYVAPRYVLGRQTGDGKFIPEPAPEQRQVISPESAAQGQPSARGGRAAGTGTAAQLAGFGVAGKTGTAWKAQNPHHPFDAYLDPDGVRHLSSSFMGYLPAEDPQISIMVILDDVTNISYSGGKIAAPLFASIADFTTRALNISPTTEAEASVVRVRATPELPPPPPTIEAATTTIPTTTIPATTAPTKATTTTTRAAATAAPTTKPVATTARAPTTRSG